MNAALFPITRELPPFIDRRHMGANSGLVSSVGVRWQRSGRNLAERSCVRRSLLALEYLDDGNDELGDVGSDRSQTTTVDRVLNNPTCGMYLGSTSIRRPARLLSRMRMRLQGDGYFVMLIGEMARPTYFQQGSRRSRSQVFHPRLAERAVRREGPSAPSPTPPSQPQSCRANGRGNRRSVSGTAHAAYTAHPGAERKA